jgi:hypothetical protein
MNPKGSPKPIRKKDNFIKYFNKKLKNSNIKLVSSPVKRTNEFIKYFNNVLKRANIKLTPSPRKSLIKN